MCVTVCFKQAVIFVLAAPLPGASVRPKTSFSFFYDVLAIRVFIAGAFVQPL